MTRSPAAIGFDALLGSPDDPGVSLSRHRSLAHDDAETFPIEADAALDIAGVGAHYVPVRHGGLLERYDIAGQLLQTVAQRDLTVAIAHAKTFLGAASVWVAGDPVQADRLGALCCRGERVSWGLTERDHGADLLATEVVAVRDERGYRLTGEKWLINNARRGRLCTTLAVTSPGTGPRSLSLFLVDHDEIPAATVRSVPRVALHGIRGADISGLVFTDTPIPRNALVGPEGAGLDIVVKTLQLTRVMCAPLSVGAAHHALELAVRHTLETRRFGARVADLPFARRLVGEAAADTLLAELLAETAARSIHSLPGELAVTSAVTKYLVPVLGQQTIGRCATLLGAHGLLAAHPFQKIARDHRLVGIFDGSAIVNLHGLVGHLPVLARGWAREHFADGLAIAGDPTASLPSADLSALRLAATRGSSLLGGLPEAMRRTADLAGDAAPGLAAAAIAVHIAARTRLAEVHDLPPLPWTTPAHGFDLAAELAWCGGAAAAAWRWIARPEPRSGRWLEAVLVRVLDRLTPGACAEPARSCLDELGSAITSAAGAGRLVSVAELTADEPSAP